MNEFFNKSDTPIGRELLLAQILLLLAQKQDFTICSFLH
jgi:hypothetical protein